MTSMELSGNALEAYNYFLFLTIYVLPEVRGLE